MGACYGCGKLCHKLTNCLNIPNRGRDGSSYRHGSHGGQGPQGGQQGGSPHHNRFYAIQGK